MNVRSTERLQGLAGRAEASRFAAGEHGAGVSRARRALLLVRDRTCPGGLRAGRVGAARWATLCAALAAMLVAGCGSPTEPGGNIDAGGSGADAGGGQVLISEDFSDHAGAYASGDTLGDFTVLRAVDEAVVAAAEDEGIAPHRGDNVLYFSAFEDEPGFRHSRLDQCVSLDPALPLSFDYHVYAAVDEITDDLRVRVNPNFYENVLGCEDDVLVDSTENRLEELGAWYNEDWDVRLESAGAEPGEWFHATASTDNAPSPDFRLEPEHYPSDTGAVRFSVRVRDDAFAEDESRRLYLGDLNLEQP